MRPYLSSVRRGAGITPCSPCSLALSLSAAHRHEECCAHCQGLRVRTGEGCARARAGWIGPSRYAQVPGQLLVDSSSFPPSASTSESPSAHRAGLHSVPGQLTIFNTMEQLQKSCDKAQLLRKVRACAQYTTDQCCC